MHQRVKHGLLKENQSLFSAQCVLQETHSNEMEEKFWSNQGDDKIIFSHGTKIDQGGHTSTSLVKF